MTILAELRRRWWLALLVLIVLLLLFGSRIAHFYTEVLWYQSVEFAAVFWTLLTTRIGLGMAAGVIMGALVAANLHLARRLAPAYRIPSPQEAVIERYREVVEPFWRPLLLGAALVTGLLTGLSAVAEWERFLLWSNAVEFGRADPHFGRDIGYFVFVLPWHAFLNSWLFTALALTIVLTAVGHYLFGGIRPQAPGTKLTPQVSVHLSILLAALVAVRAWGFWLDRYLLSYSERGTVTGLSYTDVNAQLRAFELLTVIAVVCVLLFLANLRFRGWLLPSAGMGILLVAAVVLSGIYPAAIQRLQVEPQEEPREREYIQRNLEETRFAFGLDEVEYEPFPAAAELSDSEIADNRATLEAIRLWDPATLQNTYSQLQVLRPYYDFRDVDVDRYTLDDQLTQVMISVRELNTADLPAEAQTWQNRHLVYTHGFGLVSSNVSTARGDGQPVFFVNDIPPQGVEELAVDNPRIYFGENPPQYSIVDTDQPEFDFPLQGGGQELYSYTGADGVGVGSPLRRLAFGLRYAEPNFVLSNLINSDSRIIYNRNVRERVERVAPFLELDHDPYPVAVNGRINWVIDAYTTSDMVPYSERVDLGALTPADQRVFVPVQTQEGQVELREQVRELPGLEGRANYIRNSVKAVVDAYDGSVTLYVVEPDDPVIRAWRNVFPDSFVDGDEAPEELWRHFRYPEDMFRVQSSLFNTYHIENPTEFYTREDAWAIPVDAAFARNQENAAAGRADRRMRPYYLLMKLPGEEEEEFALIQPFTPSERPNLIAWLAGRSDGENYGQLRAYVMPPDRTVFGPGQIQARVDQEDQIARQVALWNQSGSRVIYGNLLVYPVEEALLYVQPLFLRAERGDIPELRAVVLILGDEVVFSESLEAGLVALFGEAAPATIALPEGADEAPGAEDGESTVDPRVTELIQEAIAAFATAEEALQAGDLGAYQEGVREAQTLLEEAQGLSGTAGAGASAGSGEDNGLLDEDADEAPLGEDSLDAAGGS